MGHGNRGVGVGSRKPGGGYRWEVTTTGGGEREESQKVSGFWPGEGEPTILCAEMRSKCWWQGEEGASCFEYIEFAVPSRYARDSRICDSMSQFLLHL